MRAQIQDVFDRIDLKKKFPGYFTLWVFRTFMIAMLCFVGLDFYLNDFSFYSFTFECQAPAGAQCRNLLYDCDNVPVEHMFSPDLVCMRYTSDAERERYCKSGICDMEFVPSGFHIGRRDIFARHGLFFIFLFPIGAFVVNGLIHRIKNGTWLPKRSA